MTFGDVRAKVFEKSPIFGEIFTHRGGESVFEYFDSQRGPTASTYARSQPLLDAVHNITARCLGESVAHDAVDQLKRDYIVSTADHHGPLTHPFFFDSNFLRSMVLKERGVHTHVVLACGGISLSNSSFPRGLTYHDEMAQERHLSLMPWRDRRHPVYGHGAYTKEWITRINTIARVEGGTYADTLSTLLADVFVTPEVLTFKQYAEQITYTNFHLWKKLPGMQNTHMLYLQQEDVVNRALLDYHLENDTFVARILTNGQYIDAYEKHFRGIKGAFSEGDKGTFLFWLLRDGRRESLHRDGQKLSTVDGTYTLNLDIPSVRTAIENGELFPSMALMFIVCAFYHGLTCMGGFSQVTYLAHMKDAYRAVLDDVHAAHEEYEALSVATDWLSGDILFMFTNIAAQNVRTTSIDLLIHQQQGTYQQLLELGKHCTLAESLDQMLPDLYKIYYGDLPKDCPVFPYPSL